MGTRYAHESLEVGEERRFGIDFAVEGGLADNDTIHLASSTANVYDEAGVDRSATMLKGVLQKVGEELSILVVGAGSPQQIRLTLVGKTSGGETLPEHILIPVVAAP